MWLFGKGSGRTVMLSYGGNVREFPAVSRGSRWYVRTGRGEYDLLVDTGKTELGGLSWWVGVGWPEEEQ